MAQAAIDTIEFGEGAYAADMWRTDEMPVNNTVTAAKKSAPQLWPSTSGTILRHFVLPPEENLKDSAYDKLGNAHVEGSQHSGMHASNTLDYVICVSGEVWYVTEAEEQGLGKVAF